MTHLGWDQPMQMNETNFSEISPLQCIVWAGVIQ